MLLLIIWIIKVLKDNVKSFDSKPLESDNIYKPDLEEQKDHEDINF